LNVVEILNPEKCITNKTDVENLHRSNFPIVIASRKSKSIQ